MKDVQLKKIIETFTDSQDKAIGKGIEKYVNGYMREMKIVLEDIKKDMGEHIQEDREWKAEAKKFREEKLEPIVETSGHFTWWGKLVKASLGLIILVGGALAVVSRFI